MRVLLLVLKVLSLPLAVTVPVLIAHWLVAFPLTKVNLGIYTIAVLFLFLLVVIKANQPPGERRLKFGYSPEDIRMSNPKFKKKEGGDETRTE